MVMTFDQRAFPSRQSRSEIDLRQEMTNTLHGHYPEISKGTVGMLRSMNRDSNGKLIKCDCVDDTTGEPDRDSFCPICFCEGSLWHESWVTFYRIVRSAESDFIEESFRKPGTDKIDLANFYFEYDVTVTESDKIIEMEQDLEGNLTLPYRRAKIYRINSVVPMRSDYGRVEFVKVKAVEEDVKYLNHPGRA